MKCLYQNKHQKSTPTKRVTISIHYVPVEKYIHFKVLQPVHITYVYFILHRAMLS
jgi:hypothetical protein